MEGIAGKKKKYKMCEVGSINDLENLDSSKAEAVQNHSHKGRGHHGDSNSHATPKQNQVGTVMLFGVPIVSLVMDGKERLCLAQISSTLLKEFSYNEIHNRRVALGITCIQCTPVQLEILRRAGAMPVTSRRCGMITRREAERLCQSFLGDHAPPQLPENFAFEVYHECAWGCRGAFVPSRYNSSRAKCIRCTFCQLFFSPNKFIFHSHRLPDSRYVQPDAANFNSWRRHLKLCGDPPEEVSCSPALYTKITPGKEEGNGGGGNSTAATTTTTTSSSRSKDSLAHSITSSVMATAQIVHAWEDVKAMFNGGTRKRLLAAHSIPNPNRQRPPPSSATASHKNSTSSSSSSSSALHHQHHHLHNNNNSGSHNNSNGNSGSHLGVSSRAGTPHQTSVRHQAGQMMQQFGHHHHHHHQHPCDLPGISIASSNASAFMNPSPSSSSSPLLSPAGSTTPRLDSIWNPGITTAAAAAAAAAAAVAASRQCQMNPSSAPALPPLPFHPLSIPWLRRPLFPFSHPFGPTCKLFGEAAAAAAAAGANNGTSGIIPPESLVASSLVAASTAGAAQQQQQRPQSAAQNNINMSAFKPVGRTAQEQLFSWLNNNNIHSMTGMLHSAAAAANNAILPEDLSIGSTCPSDLQQHHEGSLAAVVHHANKAGSLIYGNGSNHPLVALQHPSFPPSELNPNNKELLVVNPSLSSSDSSNAAPSQLTEITSKKYHLSSVLSRPLDPPHHHHHHLNNHQGGSNEDTEEDEENVDIESTDHPQESFSPPNGGGGGGGVSHWMSSANNHSLIPVTIPNPNSGLIHRSQQQQGRLKRVMIDDSAGEEEDEEQALLTEDDEEVHKMRAHRNNNEENYQRPSQNQHHNNSSSGGGGGGGGGKKKKKKKKRLWDCDRRMIKTSSDQRLDTNTSRSNSSSNSSTPELLSLTD